MAPSASDHPARRLLNLIVKRFRGLSSGDAAIQPAPQGFHFSVENLFVRHPNSLHTLPSLCT
jgi:hypothetical protein